MLTEFGKFTRKLRIDKNELLIDMSKNLNVTSSFLSAVEVGKRNVPSKWMDILAEKYSLNEQQILELRTAIANSITQVKINLQNKDEQEKNLVLAFARKLDTLDTEEKDKMLKFFRDVLGGTKNGWL